MTGLSILVPAALAGLLVLLTHVPLGRIVLARGIVFIDLAIAQIAALGVVAADFGGWEPGGWQTQASAFSAALGAAGFLIWAERRLSHLQEAVIGVVFVAASAAQVLLLSFSTHGAEHLKDLLAGQILWVTLDDLWPVALLYAPLLVIEQRVDLREHRAVFYGVFALAITASVQLVGVLLVFASLIVPALAVQGMRRWQTGTAYGIGVAGYASGLAASLLADLPTGAAAVCGLVTVAALFGLTRLAVSGQ